MNNIEQQIEETGNTYYYTLLGANNFYYETFVVENSDNPTLLIFGDSYASAIEPLLCAHFSKIYFTVYLIEINAQLYCPL